MAGTTFTIKTKEVLSQDYANALLRTLSETLVNDMNNNTSFTAHLEPECSVVITPPKKTVKIEQDEYPHNPLEDDEFFIMHCKHRRYNLGHKDAADPFEEDDITGERKVRDDVLAMLPLYLYDHGGITMSTGSFSCPWDSGQVGWIYCTAESLAITGTTGTKEELCEYMADYVKRTYDQYLRGNCWHYQVFDENGDVVDSCSGFIGDELEDCGILDNIDSELHDAAKAAWEKRF